MTIILAVLISNSITVFVMYRIMMNLPGVLEARAYEERIKTLSWEDIKWLQETGSSAPANANDPRSNLHRWKVSDGVVPRKPSFGIKVSGAMEGKIEVN